MTDHLRSTETYVTIRHGQAHKTMPGNGVRSWVQSIDSFRYSALAQFRMVAGHPTRLALDHRTPVLQRLMNPALRRLARNHVGVRHRRVIIRYNMHHERPCFVYRTTMFSYVEWVRHLAYWSGYSSHPQRRFPELVYGPPT